MNSARAVLVFLVFGFFGQMLYYFPNLPERIATHFDAAGEPDGWMPKTVYLVVFTVFFVFIMAKLALVPAAIERLPVSLINLPNHDFWLADERRSETFAVIRKYFEWFSAAIAGLFIAINELVFRANLAKQNLSSSILIVIVLFVIFVVVWVTKLILRFKKTE